MNKTVVLGGIILFFIVSGLINFIDKLQEEVDNPSKYSENTTQLDNEKYYDANVVGEQIVLLNGLPISKKREVWNTSLLKREMMELFPKFSLMHDMIEERMIDESDFKEGLLHTIESTEEAYIGGSITGERAKALISSY